MTGEVLRWRLRLTDTGESWPKSWPTEADALDYAAWRFTPGQTETYSCYMTPEEF